ncbi:MAG: UpxY family transcription antiterminator [Alistipes sp.]|nr:UpxY family transcription antiterminator [Candidatus Alistipes equi]
MDSYPLDSSLEICGKALLDPPSWYVMRFLFNHRKPTMDDLQKRQMTYFTPMRLVKKNRGGRLVEEKEPVIRSLLFIYSNYRSICELRERNSYLQFRYVKGGQMHEPMRVRKADMDEFIFFSNHGKDPVYFDVSLSNFSIGERIRIIRGPLVGREAVLKKIPGRRSRQATIQLEDVIGVAVQIEVGDFVKI